MNLQAKRISELMTEYGMSYSRLSQLTGIARSALQRYATGATAKIPHERIELIAEALGVSPAYLLGWSEFERELPEGAEPYDPVMYKIPVLGEIAAGMPIYAEQNIDGYIYTEHKGDYFALKVRGDSMNAARINDGDILIVRCQENVENGEIAVVMVNDENATVKQFHKDGKVVQLIPNSYNPAHKVQVYDVSCDSIRIVGKVVESKTMF